MLPSLLLPTISTLTTLTFTFISIVLFNVPFSPSVHAQKFKPVEFRGSCNAFVEGQGLYFVGITWDPLIPQSFMLDLSVSWNTSDPAYKTIRNPEGVLIEQCEMTSDGEHLFVSENDIGFVYSVESDTWTEFNDNDMVSGGYATADPETGIIYLPGGGEDSKGKELMLLLDLRTKAVNKTVLPADFTYSGPITWSSYLKSMIIFNVEGTLQLFTPSKVSKSSTGWSKLKIGPMPDPGPWKAEIGCLVPAYGGTKLVLSVYSSHSTVYTLDLVTRTWKKGPPAPSVFTTSCAVSGDQLILWGGKIDFGIGRESTMPFVYNMKTEEWTTKYTAPPSQSTMTKTSQSPTQHISYTTTTPDHRDVSSSDMKLTTIVVIVTGSLLVIILTAINVYLGISRRSKVDTHRTTYDDSSFDSPDTAVSTLLPKGTP
ncbi:MAG: hypothetical protein J3Q66DRAFT_324324 [Benniella sp.]|nr:MAG: hypothetical protein J3Q66DRAFT_324324 [Benniella sp.]